MDEETDELPSFEYISDRLKEPREKLLQVYNAHDGDTFDTSKLRRASEVAPGSMDHHLRTLAKWGLIEELDERKFTEHGGGDKSRLWRLTDRGARFIDEEIVFVPPTDLDDLARRVVELERELAEEREARKEAVEKTQQQAGEHFQQIKNALPSENGSEAH